MSICTVNLNFPKAKFVRFELNNINNFNELHLLKTKLTYRRSIFISVPPSRKAIFLNCLAFIFFRSRMF